MAYFNAKIHKIRFDFGWCSVPDLAGELAAFPIPLAGFKGPTSRGEERKVHV